MSRIRNRLRFQSPEERVLNGLLVVVLIVLGTLGLNKWRDDHTVATPTQVRGIQVSRLTSPRRTDATTPSPSVSVSTTTTPAPDPMLVYLYTVVANQHRHAKLSTTTTTAPFLGFPSQPTPSTTTTTMPTTTTTKTTTPTTDPPPTTTPTT